MNPLQIRIGVSIPEKKQTLGHTGQGGEIPLDELDLVVLEIFGEYRLNGHGSNVVR